MDEIRSYTLPVYGNTAKMVESWLRQILQSSSGYPVRSVLDMLTSVLHVTSLQHSRGCPCQSDTMLLGLLAIMIIIIIEWSF